MLQIMYINLDSRPDRRKSITQNLRDMGVPLVRTHRLTATDRAWYPTPVEMVRAAREMGFPEFEINLEQRVHLKYLGYMISLFRALDWVADQKNNVLVMEDDYCLSEKYTDITRSLRELESPINIAMLGWNKNAMSIRPCQPLSYVSKWQIGTPSNGNQGNIYSPEGAALILEQCKNGLPSTPEVTIKELPLDTPRCHARPNTCLLYTSDAADE